MFASYLNKSYLHVRASFKSKHLQTTLVARSNSTKITGSVVSFALTPSPTPFALRQSDILLQHEVMRKTTCILLTVKTCQYHKQF